MATGQVGFVDSKKVCTSIQNGPSPPLSIYLSPPPPAANPTNPTKTKLSPLPPPTQTKKTLIPTRLNPTINRLEKTRRTYPPSSLPSDKDAYVARQRAKKRLEADRRRKEEERLARERRAEKEGREKGWEELMKAGGDRGRSNVDGFDEEDFM